MRGLAGPTSASTATTSSVFPKGTCRQRQKRGWAIMKRMASCLQGRSRFLTAFVRQHQPGGSHVITDSDSAGGGRQAKVRVQSTYSTALHQDGISHAVDICTVITRELVPGFWEPVSLRRLADRGSDISAPRREQCHWLGVPTKFVMRTSRQHEIPYGYCKKRCSRRP